MEPASIAEFLLLEAVAVAVAYALAATLLRGATGFFNRPLLTGVFASLFVNGFVALSGGLDAFVLVSLFFGFVYGLAGGAALEFLRRSLARWRAGRPPG